MAILERETAKKTGERIAELRHEMGLSQKELGEKIGASRALVADWESGTRLPDVTSWVKMSELFCVSCDYLCGASTHRIFKGKSFTEKLDIERLNDRGVNMLFGMYELLLKDKEFLKNSK